MTYLFVFRDKCREFYQKYNKIIIPIIRFVVAYYIFKTINNEIGYDERLTRSVIVLGLSAISAVTPSSVMLFLASVVCIVHIFAASKILALLFFLVIGILYFMFARFASRYAWAVIAIPILHKFNLDYAVAIVLGMTASPVAVLSVGCGSVITTLFSSMKEAMTMSSATIKAAEDVLALYMYVVKALISDKEMFARIAVFAAVLCITWFVRKLRITHAFEIAIAAGTLVAIVSSLLCGMMFDYTQNVFKLLVGCLLAGVIGYVVQFFSFILDYTAVEKVQFDDDDYYYYVKAVPKAKVTSPEKNVKTISAEKEPEPDETEEFKE